MNINIQWFVITTHPVAFIIIINLQLSVGDDSLYPVNNFFTGFHNNAVNRILCKDDIDILSGYNGIEITYRSRLPDDSPGAGKAICSGFITGNNNRNHY
jgi:hypothetical protein